MSIVRPELKNLGIVPDLSLKRTHPKHMAFQMENFLSLGNRITDTEKKIGAEMVIRSGTFEDAMLGALDKVSAYQQFASDVNQKALLDPDSVNVEDVMIAQAQANMALNITRNVLNRVIQGWRDLINTR